MINGRDFVKLDFIKYDLFIFNHRFDDSKVNNINYKFDCVRLK